MSELHPLITETNPMGTDGFEFVEFSSAHPAELATLFRQLGFVAIARHRSKDVTLYRQGDVNFLINAEPNSFAQNFTEHHGPCACAMAFRVGDAGYAYERALSLGAKPAENKVGAMELNIPAIEGIGGSQIYLVDRYGNNGNIYDIDFIPIPDHQDPGKTAGLTYLDHLTHNVVRGHMDQWADYYHRLFNFREIRYFDIEGKLTGLKSRAMTSPCGKIRIPINESSDDKSQIEEYLREYNGEGIQHIAMGCQDIYSAVDWLRSQNLDFMPPPPDTYYQMLPDRIPDHGEDIDALKQHAILLDGHPGGGILLQIFTKTVIGPIFFELIQRKGDEGFGEGNFQALFESIERDQQERGVL